ncbi:MAG: acyl carrier protein [Elusimicrobia bacterium]|jgi:acyl carrier protein|nr:acyl carrier protein [Elusimicrobiota bacterium]
MKPEIALESELKQLIVKTLNLEDVKPESIESDQPLFVEGLGLDSIDALELSVAIGKKFGVKIEGKSMDYRKHFSSVNTLAKFIVSQDSEKYRSLP